MKKVVHITDSASRLAGGMFESVRGMSRGIEATGTWQTSVIANEDRYSAEDKAAWGNASLDFVKRSRLGSFGSSWAMSKLCAENFPDVVHLHGIWGPASLAARYILNQSPKPAIVISPRGMLEPWALERSRLKKSVAWNAWMKGVVARTDCFHALCDEEADSIRAIAPKASVVVIPNGVDLSGYAANAGPRQKSILFLGRLHSKKGLLPLLAAWSTLSSVRAQGWRLIVAGWDDGGFEATLRAESSRLGIDETVVFHGPAFGADKEGLLGNCAAFALPSFSEGLPMAVLEAWGHRMPVLMTRECHLNEGFAADAAVCVEPTAESIAAGLRQLIENMDDVEREAMGQRGRALAETRFSWNHIGATMTAAYERILESRR
ncbi:glycosyltransferase [Roseiarcaceae bacterium H3SJ34-1]|uniref:glycosyltransferase n=1 Tax=Terripilifer ovatus TaxID=3032367 RepID=UPI003AB9453A|nr:glycosyltransferase [Roseiarcaceae bacterium H3SJ34-1]